MTSPTTTDGCTRVRTQDAHPGSNLHPGTPVQSRRHVHAPEWGALAPTLVRCAVQPETDVGATGTSVHLQTAHPSLADVLAEEQQ